MFALLMACKGEDPLLHSHCYNIINDMRCGGWCSHTILLDLDSSFSGSLPFDFLQSEFQALIRHLLQWDMKSWINNWLYLLLGNPLSSPQESAPPRSGTLLTTSVRKSKELYLFTHCFLMIKKINIELFGTYSSKLKHQAYSNCEYRDKAGTKYSCHGQSAGLIGPFGPRYCSAARYCSSASPLGFVG